MSRNSGTTVYVGLSGGVDSSVTAALLLEQGYNVVGVYMKNWSQDLPGMPCPWKDDFQDAKRVAVQLGIDFKMFDFEAEYRQKVVDYMIEEYKAGRTPNPDVMCNQEIKFKIFLEASLEDGADLIATGHYARIVASSEDTSVHADTARHSLAAGAQIAEDAHLHVAANKDKDQTYFLYRVKAEALARSLMPIGEFSTKEEVRQIAKDKNLVTAGKKDSQGICFVGKVGIRDFLSQYVETAPGLIKDQNGVTIGEHDGAIFYTVGQRHGLNVGGGLPYYVVGKDMTSNEVYVTTKLDDDKLWKGELKMADLHWINQEPVPSKKYQIRTRYRASLIDGTIETEGGTATIKLADKVRAVTPGQSAVVYDGDRVVGGGIII